MQNHFSVSAAADLLERNRRTIARALRDTPPDSFERKQRRWKMSTIVAALEANADKPMRAAPRPKHAGVVFATIDDDLENDRRTLQLFDPYNQIVAELVAEPDIDRRRSMAIERIPKTLDAALAAYRAKCVASGEFFDGDSRADLMTTHLLERFKILCDWSHDEIWKHLLVWEDEEE